MTGLERAADGRTAAGTHRRARQWTLLTGAIAVEVTATLSLKAALTAPGWYVVVVLGYASAFALLAGCLRAGMGIGVAYGVWGAVGVAVTAALAAVVFGEPFTALMGVGVALIAAGVLAIEMGSPHPTAEADG